MASFYCDDLDCNNEYLHFKYYVQSDLYKRTRDDGSDRPAAEHQPEFVSSNRETRFMRPSHGVNLMRQNMLKVLWQQGTLEVGKSAFDQCSPRVQLFYNL